MTPRRIGQVSSQVPIWVALYTPAIDMGSPGHDCQDIDDTSQEKSESWVIGTSDTFLDRVTKGHKPSVRLDDTSLDSSILVYGTSSPSWSGVTVMQPSETGFDHASQDWNIV